MKKKLLALPALGAAAALAFGAAASLTPGDDNAALQVGTVLDLTCAESASVAGWDYIPGSRQVNALYVHVEDGDGDCYGAKLYATLININSQAVASGNTTITSSGSNTYWIGLNDVADAETVTAVRIAVVG